MPRFGLTEARVRGAIRTLEEVGFLDRAVASGSTHKPTPDGLHRKPVLFMFGASMARCSARPTSGLRRPVSGVRGLAARLTPARPPQPSTGVLAARPLNSPKNKDSEADKVIMGEIRRNPALQNRPYKTQRWTPPWTAGKWLSRKPGPQGSARSGGTGLGLPKGSKPRGCPYMRTRFRSSSVDPSRPAVPAAVRGKPKARTRRRGWPNSQSVLAASEARGSADSPRSYDARLGKLAANAHAWRIVPRRGRGGADRGENGAAARTSPGKESPKPDR